jgi:hypothetical protein
MRFNIGDDLPYDFRRCLDLRAGCGLHSAMEQVAQGYHGSNVVERRTLCCVGLCASVYCNWQLFVATAARVEIRFSGHPHPGLVGHKNGPIL